MLLSGGNPYRGGLPERLTLDWNDFDFGISPANDAAMGQVADWAVFAYLAADCNLAEWMFDDLLEMKAVGSGASVHVLALFDGPLLTDSFLARLNPDTPLADDVVLRFRQLRTSDRDTLAGMLRVAGAWPARNRLLVLGGHGQGWRGALLDENRGQRYLDEPGRLALPGPPAACDARLRAAQVRAQDRLNRELARPDAPRPEVSILALDACYMGNIEAMGTLASQAPLMVVSEDRMPEHGLAYHAILTALERDPGQTPRELVTTIVDATAARYRAASPPRPVALAGIETEGLRAFAAAFVALIAALDPADLPHARDALDEARAFGRTGMIDLKGLLLKLAEHLPGAPLRAAAATALARFDATRIAFAGDGTPGGTNGLSIYAPPAAAFDMAYADRANALPFSLGIWAWFLAGFYLDRFGADAQALPLLQAIEAMQPMLAAARAGAG